MRNIKNLTNAVNRLYRDIKGEISEKDFTLITNERLQNLPVKTNKKLYELNPFKLKNYNYKTPLIIDEEEKLYLLSAKQLVLSLTPHLSNDIDFEYKIEYCKKYLPGFIYSNPIDSIRVGGAI